MSGIRTLSRILVRVVLSVPHSHADSMSLVSYSEERRLFDFQDSLSNTIFQDRLFILRRYCYLVRSSNYFANGTTLSLMPGA